MNFLDLFAGIGGFRLGMEQAGHKCVGYVEFDKFARQSYQSMHDTKGEWTSHDITRVTDDDIRQLRDRGRIDIICGGFPCQAFSIAGKRGGFNDTRGTLFFEIVRFANIIRPRYLFLENVKGLLNHDDGNTFETILGALDELGYDAEWEVLNSKDFGVPQNRERVFIIGHLRGTSTRKVFPITGTNGKTNNTDGTVIIDDTNTGFSGVKTYKDYAPTLRSERYGLKVFGELDINANDQNKRVYDTSGISPTLTTMQGGGQEPKIVRPVNKGEGIKVREATKKGYVEAHPDDGIRLDQPGSKTGRGRVQQKTSPTLLTGVNVGTLTKDYRIRKLTPKECFRLQGFPDELFHKAEQVNSDSQLYKQAGNSVTVNVIQEIGKKTQGA